MIGRSSIRGIAQIGNPVSGRGLSTSRGGGGTPINENFEILVDTTLAGSAADTMIIPTVSGIAYDFTVDWGDGNSEAVTSSTLSSFQHTYDTGGEYTIKISGTFPRIYFNNTGDKDKLKQILNFGAVGWTSMERAFYGCSNLTSGGGYSDFSAVTSFVSAFQSCSSLTILDVSAWNISAVTSFGVVFYNCSSLTALDVSAWNTSAVISFNSAFQNCTSLTTLDVSGWDTSSVTSFNYSFFSCTSLTTLDVSGWDTSSVTSFNSAFQNCSSLTTLDVSAWNTSSVTSFDSSFFSCTSLTTLDVSGWDTSSVTSFDSSFLNCSSLTTLDVSAWNTSAVTSFYRAFQNCSSLTTLDVSAWNTSAVTTFYQAFYGCTSLTTLDVSGWDTSSVTSFTSAFRDCTSLKIDCSSFTMTGVTDVTNMFAGCNINETGTTTNYDNTLVAWAAQDLVNSLSINFGDSQYSTTGETAKNAIIADDLWTFTDAGLAT